MSKLQFSRPTFQLTEELPHGLSGQTAACSAEGGQDKGTERVTTPHGNVTVKTARTP